MRGLWQVEEEVLLGGCCHLLGLHRLALIIIGLSLSQSEVVQRQAKKQKEKALAWLPTNRLAGCKAVHA